MGRKTSQAKRPPSRAFSIAPAQASDDAPLSPLANSAAPASLVCPLCQRQIPKSQRDLHHWIPKLKGGKVTTALHRICHRQIHAQFSEAVLARELNTPEALLQQKSIQVFLEWVKKKPDDFYETTRTSREKRGKVRRK
jgi:hypothetical protein